MEEFIQLFLRAQTVLGLIPFLVLVISDCVMTGVQHSSYKREAFSCDPRLNASSQQRCYDYYTIRQFFNLRIMLILDVSFCCVWIFSIVKTTLALRQIKRSREIQNNESGEPINPRLKWSPAEFMERTRCGMCVFVTHVSLVLILLCFLYAINSGFGTSSMFKCSLVTNTTSFPLSQIETDFYCYDENFKEHVNFNIATTVIKFVIWILCMISFVYVLKTPEDKLMDTLLGDVAEERESNQQGETKEI